MSATARLMAFLGMDASQFTGGVDKAEKRVHGFSKALGGVKGKIAAAFSIAAVGAAVKGIADKASDIADVAENLSITTDEFQALSIAAKQFGVEGDQVSLALGKMAAAQAEFVSGGATQETLDRMAALGISLDQADAMNAAEFFEAVAKGSQNSAEGLDASMKMIGRTGPKFQAFMKLVSGTGLSGLVAGAKGSGEMISEADVTATDAVLDGIIEKWKNKAIKAAAVVVGAVAQTAVKATQTATVNSESGEAKAERNRAARTRADETAASKIAEDAADIRKKTAYELLTAEEKITALKAEQAELDAKMGAAATATARAELDKQRAEIEGKISGLEAGNQKSDPGMAYDQLRRIGAGVFSGTASDAIPKNQLAELRKMSLSLNRIEGKKNASGGIF